MRKILFRGKQRDTDEWSYGSLQCFKGYSIFDMIWKNFMTVDSKTIGQYTGFEDKNGNKIFEGDIVKCTCCGEFRTVIFDENLGSFEFDTRDPVENPDGSCLCADHIVYEVIGNIYDNPELLGG